MACNDTKGWIPKTEKFSQFEAHKADIQILCAGTIRGSLVGPCALPDTCIGGATDTLTTVTDALAAGFQRIRIRGDVTEPATVVMPSGDVVIWIDGDRTWELPADATIDTSTNGTTTLRIEGNGKGRLLCSYTGSAVIAGTNTACEYIIRDTEVDYSATTSVGATGVQLFPEAARQTMYNVQFNVPNLADLLLISFSAALTFPRVLYNVEFTGGGGAVTRIIGSTIGSIGQCYCRDLTFSGSFAVGDQTFASSIIDFTAPVIGGQPIFDGLYFRNAPSVDIAVGGSVSNVRVGLGIGGSTINVQLAGLGSSLSDSDVNYLEVIGSDCQCTNVRTSGGGMRTLTGSRNVFSSCFFLGGTGIYLQFLIGGARNTFTSCYWRCVATSDVLVSGDHNTFSSCIFDDEDLGNPGTFFLRIAGNNNILSGCSNPDGGSTYRDVQIFRSSFTTFEGCNFQSPLFDIFECDQCKVVGCMLQDVSITGLGTANIISSTRLQDLTITGGGSTLRTKIEGCELITSTTGVSNVSEQLTFTNNTISGPIGSFSHVGSDAVITSNVIHGSVSLGNNAAATNDCVFSGNQMAFVIGLSTVDLSTQDGLLDNMVYTNNISAVAVSETIGTGIPAVTARRVLFVGNVEVGSAGLDVPTGVTSQHPNSQGNSLN
jgi:hypothetical protein